jgi:uncharacterized protein (TIGR00725 family)
MQSPPPRAPQTSVIGDSDTGRAQLLAAEEVGEMLAQHGITVVTGGRGGVMEAAGRGAMRAGGLVLGILPSADPRDASPWCSIVLPTGMGHARNALTALAGDLVISVGGGAGTLSELCLAWIHRRPILLYTGHGGWSDRLDEAGLDPRRGAPIRACPNLQSLEREVLCTCQALGLAVRG